MQKDPLDNNSKFCVWYKYFYLLFLNIFLIGKLFYLPEGSVYFLYKEAFRK